MSKYKNIIAVVLIIASVLGVCGLYHQNKVLREDLSIAVANEKSLLSENSLLEDKSRGLQFTVDQLEYFRDSLIVKMNEVRKELGVKDKDLKQMQYLLSQAQKKDTIIFRDTIFRSPDLRVDTLLGDKWYQMNLKLRYPSTIITEPKFTSEKYIIVDYRKETVDPPKKCFIGRWFQKKHKVIEVEVVEKNPYIENKQQRFIEIIK